MIYFEVDHLLGVDDLPGVCSIAYSSSNCAGRSTINPMVERSPYRYQAHHFRTHIYKVFGRERRNWGEIPE